MHAQSLSRVRLFACPWIVACQAPLSVGFPSKNIGVGCHFLLQGILPTPGLTESVSPASPPLAGRFFTTEPPGKPWYKQDQAYIPKLVLGISLEISLFVCVPGVGWGVVVAKAVGGDYWTVSSLKPTDGTEVLAKVRRCRSKSWCSLLTLSPNCSCFPCSIRFRGFTTQQVYNWQISLALPDLNNRLKCGLAGIMKITTSWLINIIELPLENRTGMCIWVLAFGV